MLLCSRRQKRIRRCSRVAQLVLVRDSERRSSAAVHLSCGRSHFFMLCAYVAATRYLVEENQCGW
jgi:hypothetical protein